MRLFILGATGRTGRALLEQALERGHAVTAFVRSPEKLSDLADRVAVRQGDPRDADALAAALPGHDAVISALGLPGVRRSTILSDAARATVQAMHVAGVRRLAVVSVALLFDDEPVVARALRGTLLRHVARESAAMERIIAANDLDWTVARPPRLTNGATTGPPLAANDRAPPGAILSMSRADVARFLLDEIERPAHVRRVVGIGRPAGSGRRVAARLATALLVTECFVGGAMALARLPAFARTMRHLGYPRYFMTLHGIAYLLAGAALAVPGAPRLKDWAYAGLAFTYAGALASHIAARDDKWTLAAPFGFLATTLASRALRESPATPRFQRDGRLATTALHPDRP